ncbi:Recombinase domain-containing protein [Planctomycetales bacterium 10988]|nr:Recombinase domain-containing protein [Planctomycetales bacterium 10988]
MLRRCFDPTLSYRAVLYLRMSSDLQNKRSPVQQEAEIRQRIKSLGYDWRIVKVYRDDAKSGRLLRNRLGYQRMLREIKSGKVKADLILVDTLERFGRVDELPTIRKELYERHGVLVLTADSSFTDPTSPQGRALGMVESMRANEHGRILGHNVLRGKRDTARQKHWPGGYSPFGYRLQSVMKTERGREVVDYSTLVPNPKTDWIIKLLFEKAIDSGWGTARLARFLNEHRDIPADLKPFSQNAIGYWLDNPIYFGTLRWEHHVTGIVDDMRVSEKNKPEDVLIVPEFCEPLVDRDLWERVQALREARRPRRLEPDEDGKKIEAPAPGLSVNYLLSGLVYCSECSLRMQISSTGEYTNSEGEKIRYVYYYCPRSRIGICHNKLHVPETRLREKVIQTIRERLFSKSK